LFSPNYINILNILIKYRFTTLFIVLGIGDWGLGIGPNPQSPIPNPQSPIPKTIKKFENNLK
jgi:hypothetical protein